MTNEIKCYIPSTLNIEGINGYNKRWKDKYTFFIHSIVFKSLTSKDTFNSWVNLNSTIIQKYLGTKYTKKVIQTLIDNGIIQCNKSYSAGAFSKSYRLTDKYQNETIKAVTLDKKTYQRKINIIRNEYLKDVLSKSANIKAEFRKLTFARIDKEAALEYINSKYDSEGKEYKSRLIAIEQYDQMHKTNFSQGCYNINFTFKVHKGRVYSPATMLARDLERFTYFEGYENEDSAVLDMPNSQLCFYHEFTKKTQKRASQLSNNQKVNSKVHNIGSIYCIKYYENKKIDNSPQTKKKQKTLPTSPNTLPYVIPFNQKPSKIKAWEDYIFNSEGYEIMMKLSNWKGKSEGHTKDERQEFKAQFFGNLFYNKYNSRLTNLEKSYKEHFPNEFQSLRKVKKKLGNKLLAVKVQSLEAKFFHTIIVNHMRKKHPNTPFVIKHDSIKLPMSEATKVYDELNQLAKDFFNRSDINIKFEHV